MSTPNSGTATGDLAAELDADTQARITELIEEDEGATNKIGGWVGQVLIWAAVLSSVFHLYCAASGSPPFGLAPIVPTFILRPLHVGIMMALAFLYFPMARRFRHRITWLGTVLCAAAQPRLSSLTSYSSTR